MKSFSQLWVINFTKVLKGCIIIFFKESKGLPVPEILFFP
jgi:hypothetical protein